MHRTGGRCATAAVRRQRERESPNLPSSLSHSRFPNCAKSIQARPRLSFTATYRSQQMEQGARDGPLYKQLRGQTKEKSVATSERGKGGSLESGRGKHATQHTHTPRTTRRAAYAAKNSNCTKEEVLQGFRRRAAWTGMSQLTAAIRHAFPSSFATRNSAPRFPFGPREAHKRAAGQVGACARHSSTIAAAILRKNCDRHRERKHARE